MSKIRLCWRCHKVCQHYELQGRCVIGWLFPVLDVFDKFVPCVAGVNIWSTKLKILKTVTNNGFVTITDEAFTIMALGNFWGCWFHQQPAQWTDSCRGNQQFMGWSDQVYNHYDDACKLIKKQRGNTASKGLQKEFQHMQEWLMPMVELWVTWIQAENSDELDID